MLPVNGHTWINICEDQGERSRQVLYTLVYI